ncbi:MAG: endonuclease/exonuclease/phosphatase family protein [Paraglaciecola polaris]|uniref:endonuclease/exonuclease/phosphatase family protein n=1 Tax=Paraglaciecola polaris TaxID=222814 RepID=UPI0030030EE0
MYKALILIALWMGVVLVSQAQSIRIGTFNVSMEASNYLPKNHQPTGAELFERLASGQHQQIRNIAEIIQRVRPDIILLNEFDYTADDAQGVRAFIKNYLAFSQHGADPIDYPYHYTAPVNTGVPSGIDLNHDGSSAENGGDTFAFGLYPGQYGMVILSRFPIETAQIRTFQHFLWKDMPNGLIDSIKNDDGEDWYSAQAQSVFRLSSKSHWDVPVKINGNIIHVLASHPTPPVFDGPENRNGKRNHDEIRFWVDYISGSPKADYIYDDKGVSGGISSEEFIILGDLNASIEEGDADKDGIQALLSHEAMNVSAIPTSKGASLHTKNNAYAATHTAFWRMRADYVLPSTKLGEVIDSGVFWPAPQDFQYRLIKDRQSSSDHRLVWIDVELESGHK